MKIQTTTQRITKEQACVLCQNENNGLLGRVADFLRGRKDGSEILDNRLFYFPYYCTIVQMQLPKSRRLQHTALEGGVVVDGVFGIARGMEGVPQVQERELLGSSVAKVLISQKEAQEKSRELVRKYIYRKFHVFPSIDALNTSIVYKPLVAVCCRKGRKTYYQIVDTEMGCKDYTFNFRYNEVQFYK